MLNFQSPAGATLDRGGVGEEDIPVAEREPDRAGGGRGIRVVPGSRARVRRIALGHAGNFVMKVQIKFVNLANITHRVALAPTASR